MICGRIPTASCSTSAAAVSRPTTRRSKSFKGRFLDGCLNVHGFESLEDASGKIEASRQDDNAHHPHRALKGLSPMNTPGERCHPLQSHSRSGPKKPVPSSVWKRSTPGLLNLTVSSAPTGSTPAARIFFLLRCEP